jgi:hypothetical protein
LSCSGARLVALVACVVACGSSSPEQIDPASIRIPSPPVVRTDTIGDPRAGTRATFVLVDAINTSSRGAYVTISGTLRDRGGADVSSVKPQQLWMPAGEERTFALVDAELAERPTAWTVRVVVERAWIPSTPLTLRVEDVRERDDYGKVVATGVVVNDEPQPAMVTVIAAFHDGDRRPMTRPFDVIVVGPHERKAVQFVGPQGSKRGAIFLGDATY